MIFQYLKGYLFVGMCMYECKHIWMYVCIRCPPTELTRQFKNSYILNFSIKKLNGKFLS